MLPLEELNTTRREYPLTSLQRFLYLALATICFVGAGFFFKLAADPVGRDFAVIVGFIFVVPGVIVFLLALRSRLILDGSRIEVRSALRTFTADRNGIKGLRRISNRYGNWTRIYLEGHGGAFNVSDSFRDNGELNEWLEGLPDLDEREAAEIKQEVSDQYSRWGTGSSEAESLNAFKQAKTWAVVLSVAAGLAAIAVVFVTYPPLHTAAIALLVFFPPFGIFLLHRFPLLFTMFKRKSDPRADLGVVAMLPGFGMLLSDKNDPTHLVDPFRLTYWIVIILVCFLAALVRVAWENPSRWGAVFGLLVFGGMYSFGVINATNTVLDRSGAQPYRTRVLRMYETHGRSTSSHLRLARWGPLAYSEDVVVPKRIYEQLNVGDQICIGLHPGFLHAPWYTLHVCPEQLSAPDL